MRLCDAKRNGWVEFCEQIGADPDAIVIPFLGDLVETIKMPAEADMSRMRRVLGKRAQMTTG